MRVKTNVHHQFNIPNSSGLINNCNIYQWWLYVNIFQMNYDTNFIATNCVARWPGSFHDSRVFRESTLCHEFENGLYIFFKNLIFRYYQIPEMYWSSLIIRDIVDTTFDIPVYLLYFTWKIIRQHDGLLLGDSGSY